MMANIPTTTTIVVQIFNYTFLIWQRDGRRKSSVYTDVAVKKAYLRSGGAEEASAPPDLFPNSILNLLHSPKDGVNH